jgi:hypothetical protein
MRRQLDGGPLDWRDVEPLGVLALLCLAVGFLLSLLGLFLAPNLGISPVLVYSAGVSPEAGVAQPSNPRRVRGARLKLAGFGLLLAGTVFLGIAMAGTPSGEPPRFP